jgi:acyl-coenzyme A thioesterase PaaI-like protein
LKQQTHPNISAELVGRAIELAPGRAVAELVATTAMAADDRGLVHGGFTFGLADFAAMLAVNDPNVVLGGAETRFLAPVVVGETMVARAEVSVTRGKKRTIETTVQVGERTVFEGTLTCFVLEQHVLEGS